MITCERLPTGKQVARCKCDFCENSTDVSVYFGETKNADKRKAMRLLIGKAQIAPITPQPHQIKSSEKSSLEPI